MTHLPGQRVMPKPRVKNNLRAEGTRMSNLKNRVDRTCLWMILTLMLWVVVAYGQQIDEQQPGQNSTPIVTNVTARQVNLNQVLIDYDVIDPDRDQMTVKLWIFAGNQPGFQPKHLEGDVGRGISSGQRKQVFWNIGNEIPLHYLGTDYVVEVVADDQHLPPTILQWDKDKTEMVRIPAGSFEMGSDNITYATPVHTVTLDAFYIDCREVTVGQFKQFVEQSGYPYDLWEQVAEYVPTDRYPMIFVTWYDAMAYANWAGKRLPTEAEWEYAARGGLARRNYPWGNSIDHQYANYNGTGGADQWELKPTPVGSFPPNGYGLYDVAGNVFEWCLDAFDTEFYQQSPRRNPLAGGLNLEEIHQQFSQVDSGRVLRGGSYHYTLEYVRVDYRDYASPDHRFDAGGFRCVVEETRVTN